MYGNLDDSAIIEKSAAEADIVVREFSFSHHLACWGTIKSINYMSRIKSTTQLLLALYTHATTLLDTADSSDSSPAATAIAKGLAAGHSPEKPGYWIHTSGTSILTWNDARHQRFGEGPLPEQTYRDVDNIDKILDLPDEAPHRDVEKIVQGAISDSVRVAILSPPTIYDVGSGQVNTRSMQVPDLVKATLEKGFVPIAGAGLTEWDNVNVNDLGDLYVKLADATQDPSKQNDKEIFGLHGYFFADGDTHKWSDISRWVADEVSKQGYLTEPVTKTVQLEEVKQWEGGANASWGQNSKGIGQRVRKYFGWEPKGRSIKDTIAEAVAFEARALGLTQKAKAD